ncbi:hypothetical protein DAEQUDRAFT_742149, partial [Daedalea quercina L-15889]
MQAHLDTEAYLKKSGLTYTIIREGIYSESYPLYFGFWSPAESSGEVIIPHGDGGIAWVNRSDLGEGTARIISAERGYQNRTLLLSGTRTVTLSSLASIISNLLHRSIHLKVVSEDEYVAAHTGRPGPRGEADFLHKWATTYSALVRGECAVADPTLGEILGREPTPFEETVKSVLGVSGEEPSVMNPTDAVSYCRTRSSFVDSITRVWSCSIRKRHSRSLSTTGHNSVWSGRINVLTEATALSIADAVINVQVDGSGDAHSLSPTPSAASPAGHVEQRAGLVRKSYSFSSTSCPVRLILFFLDQKSPPTKHSPVLASDIIVSLYNPAGASPAIVASGVGIRKGDFADAGSLRSPFAGADKLLLVSAPTIAYELA